MSSREGMDLDQSTEVPTKSQAMETLTAGPLSSSLSSLSRAARTIPSDKDFHFFSNFDDFKLPIRDIAARSHSLLESIASNNRVFNEKFPFPADFDPDDAYDWLVNVNDEIFERFDSSLDEFRKIREAEGSSRGVVSEEGFQLVYGKRNKKTKRVVRLGGESLSESVRDSAVVGDSVVKVADKKVVVGGKAKVPFHIPTIRRPQEEFNILVNNSNQPFAHVWIERNEDESKFVHPLEKLSVMDFMDDFSGNVKPLPPLPLDCTPFKFIEEVKNLKELAAKLHSVNEFAVDLEHNQYRSFQGLTCLMQISTRTEDFIVDTLKLRIHVGPYLREVFKDPKKKKVMHGADRDIVWLQRDFGIYVCNMFDTGQASRVLKLERNSLEYLLHHFCGITAKKEYQNADWRLRPLPDEMLRYAREDTHYLLHIYDLMRASLLQMPSDTETSDSPLVEVYKRSYDVCIQLYEKELLTESSYLHIYGLPGAGLNAQQLAIVAGLFEWRDVVARAEDESTGYVLPNKTLLEIAKEKPVTISQLRRLLKSKHPYVERNLSSIVSIIRNAMQNATMFEAAVQRLKERQMETASQPNIEVNDGCEAIDSHAQTNLEASNSGNVMDGSSLAASPQPSKEPDGSSIPAISRDGPEGSINHPRNNDNVAIVSVNQAGTTGRVPISVQSRETSMCTDESPSAEVKGAAVPVLKKPTKGFGALLGSAAAKRKSDTDKKEKEESKLEKIRSSVSLPFHSFLGRNEPAKPMVEGPTKVSEVVQPEEFFIAPSTGSNLEDYITLEEDDHGDGNSNYDKEMENTQKDDKSVGSAAEMEKEDEAMSLSDLSTSFEKCFQSNNEYNKSVIHDRPEEPSGLLQFKPFDYTSARNQVRFGEGPAGKSKTNDEGNKKGGLPGSSDRRKNAAAGRVQKDDGTKEFSPARRRQAFPATGNRSATFR